MDAFSEKEPEFLVASRKLMTKLFSGNIHAGMVLKETLLSKEFEVSRRAMREALCMAVGWGIVEYVPFCGYRIRDFSLGDLLDWYQLREAIETIAVRELAENRPPEVLRELEAILNETTDTNDEYPDRSRNEIAFHLTIVNGCGNKRFADPAILCPFAVIFGISNDALVELNYRNHSFPNILEASNSPEAYRDLVQGGSQDVHREFFELIRDGKRERAESRLREHIHFHCDLLKNSIRIYGDRDTPINELLKRKPDSSKRMIRNLIRGRQNLTVQ